MIESFAIDVYNWVLGTNIWIISASYILVFSILFNTINTIITCLAISLSWMGIRFDNLDFLEKMKGYNLLHARSISIMAVIGTFLGLSMAFYTLGLDTDLPTEAFKTMLVQMQYVFVSSLFGYFLGAFWSGIIVDFMLMKLLNKMSVKELESDRKLIPHHEKSETTFFNSEDVNGSVSSRKNTSLLNMQAINLNPCKQE